MQRPVAPQDRYRAENHRQPRPSDLAAAVSCMAPSSGSEPPCVTQRPPVADLQLSEERAPEAGTSESDDQATATAAEAKPAEPSAVAEKKEDSRAAELDAMEPARRPPATAGEESSRERLKRHRTEMAGRVRIPDMWGQEWLLKDWVDCAVFDRPLAATASLLNARNALVAEYAAARRPAHGPSVRPLRVQKGCS